MLNRPLKVKPLFRCRGLEHLISEFNYVFFSAILDVNNVKIAQVKVLINELNSFQQRDPIFRQSFYFHGSTVLYGNRWNVDICIYKEFYLIQMWTFVLQWHFTHETMIARHYLRFCQETIDQVRSSFPKSFPALKVVGGVTNQ